jgi:hypothetical protein
MKYASLHMVLSYFLRWASSGNKSVFKKIERFIFIHNFLQTAKKKKKKIVRGPNEKEWTKSKNLIESATGQSRGSLTTEVQDQIGTDR